MKQFCVDRKQKNSKSIIKKIGIFYVYYFSKNMRRDMFFFSFINKKCLLMLLSSASICVASNFNLFPLIYLIVIARYLYRGVLELIILFSNFKGFLIGFFSLLPFLKDIFIGIIAFPNVTERGVESSHDNNTQTSLLNKSVSASGSERNFLNSLLCRNTLHHLVKQSLKT